MPEAPAISRVGAFVADLGECPLWEAASGRLWFMDCRRGLILGTDPESAANRGGGGGDDDAATTTVAVPAPAGSFAFNDDGRLVVALKEEIALVDPRDGALERIARIDDSHPNLRLNDGSALPDGSYLVGTMHVFRADGEPPLGGLYRLWPDGRLRRLARGIGVTNGPRVGPRDGRLYVCDSARRSIFSHAFDAAGGLTDERLFVDTDPLASAPDGCCFDDEGGLWTALVHAGALARFGPDGRLTRRIDLPVAHPTSLCFGGAARDVIYVTSIRDSGRLHADGPLDGAVLRVTGSGARGQPAPLCRLGLRATG